MNKKTIVYLANASNIHTIRWAMHFAANYNVYVISFEPATIQGVKVLILSRITNGIHKYILAAPKVRSMLKEIKPDIFHAHYAGGYGLLGALVNQHPFVISVWGSDVYITPNKSWFHKKVLSYTLSHADFLCSTSHDMAKETRKYVEREILVTPFGIDVEEYKPQISKTDHIEIVIGTVKKLDILYGIDRLIRAFDIIRKQLHMMKLRLLIVGDGEARRDLESLVKKLGINHLTTFQGEVKQEEVSGYLNKIDIYVSLSRSESFGVAVLEASACGVPVVVSDAGGLPEVVLDGVTGYLIPGGNEELAANALERLICDKDLRDDMGKNGRNHVLKMYDSKTTTRIMDDLYIRIFDA